MFGIGSIFHHAPGSHGQRFFIFDPTIESGTKLCKGYAVETKGRALQNHGDSIIRPLSDSAQYNFVIDHRAGDDQRMRKGNVHEILRNESREKRKDLRR